MKEEDTEDAELVHFLEAFEDTYYSLKTFLYFADQLMNPVTSKGIEISTIWLTFFCVCLEHSSLGPLVTSNKLENNFLFSLWGGSTLWGGSSSFLDRLPISCVNCFSNSIIRKIILIKDISRFAKHFSSYICIPSRFCFFGWKFRLRVLRFRLRALWFKLRRNLRLRLRTNLRDWSLGSGSCLIDTNWSSTSFLKKMLVNTEIDLLLWIFLSGEQMVSGQETEIWYCNILIHQNEK